jgi:tRNA(Ile)-lysidine synthase TilS/MesJ
MKFADPVQGNDDVGNELLSEDPEHLDDLAEFVVERIVSHRRDADGNMRLLLRWFGYASSEDTWEPVIHVPQKMVHRYARRKRLDPELFGVTSEKNAEPSS